MAILHPSRMDDNDQEQPQDIDHDGALAAIIAPEPPLSVVITV